MERSGIRGGLADSLKIGDRSRTTLGVVPAFCLQ